MKDEKEVKNRMNRKILVFAVTLLLLPLCTTMFAQASPIKDKNNDKFETFQVFGHGSFSVSLNPNNWQYIPSKEQYNKVIVSWDEVFTGMQIIVAGHIYNWPTDFTYTGRATWIFYDPVFPSPPPVIPFSITDFRIRHSQVDYEYTFLPASGIVGTIRMQAIIAGQGDALSYSISSLSGTGDLQNVQIKATSYTTGLPPHTPTWNLGHTGTVIGWPE
jgi:hypothetical protein